MWNTNSLIGEPPYYQKITTFSIVNNHFFENGDKSTVSAVILQSAKNKGIELTISGNELMKKW